MNQKSYACYKCGESIAFNQRKPFNADGSPHKCNAQRQQQRQLSKLGQPGEVTQEASLFALGAMNAIISAQIQAGGVDFVHHMNFQDVADAAWRAAAAMVAGEESYRDEIMAAERGRY